MCANLKRDALVLCSRCSRSRKGRLSAGQAPLTDRLKLGGLRNFGFAPMARKNAGPRFSPHLHSVPLGAVRP